MNLFRETQLDQIQMKMSDRALNSVGDKKILKLFGPNATELQKAITYAIMNSSPSGMPPDEEIKFQATDNNEILSRYIYFYLFHKRLTRDEQIGKKHHVLDRSLLQKIKILLKTGDSNKLEKTHELRRISTIIRSVYHI